MEDRDGVLWIGSVPGCWHSIRRASSSCDTFRIRKIHTALHNNDIIDSVRRRRREHVGGHPKRRKPVQPETAFCQPSA